jgi:hypothetical protein
MRELEKKESLSLEEVLSGKQRTSHLVAEEAILDMFERDPGTLHLRLEILDQLIRLAPFLHIDLDKMREMIELVLTEPPQRSPSRT